MTNHEPVPVPALELPEPGAVAAEALRRWLDAPEVPAGRVVAALRSANLLAETDPVVVSRTFNPINEEPAEVIAQAMSELLKALGYEAGCAVIPSLFGGYTVRAGARRRHPSEVSDPDGTVKG